MKIRSKAIKNHPYDDQTVMFEWLNDTLAVYDAVHFIHFIKVGTSLRTFF